MRLFGLSISKEEAPIEKKKDTVKQNAAGIDFLNTQLGAIK